MITKLIFEDGTEISSGAEPAVMSFSLTSSASSTQELEPGACCAAMAQLSLYGLDKLPEGQIRIQRIDGEVTRELGLFLPQLPERSGRLLRITAYDRLCLLDKELTNEPLGMPCSLYEFAKAVCSACGLELSNTSIPGGDHTVEDFSTAGVTGRQLLQWVGALSGGFWRATPEGAVELAWYEPRSLSLGPSDYYENSLSMASYTAQPIEKVVLKKTTDDVGLVWPNITGGAAYICQGNPLLGNADATLAQSLFERIGGISYTPCRVTVREQDIRPGDLITLDGCTVAVMTTRLQNGRLTLEATGSASRTGSVAVNQVSFKGLNGKVLELQTRVDGLSVKNRDNTGAIAGLELTVEGLKTAVSKENSGVDSRLTALEQTAQSLNLRVEQTVQEVTTSTGYRLDADGLTIARSGTQMANRLDHTGMYVQRAGQTILEASSQGVRATDVKVANYLHIGSARFEEYGNRTACFYVE